MRIGEPGCEEGNLEAGLYDIIKTRANMRCGMAYYTRTGMLYECRGHYEGVLNRPLMPYCTTIVIFLGVCGVVVRIFIAWYYT